MSDPVIQVSHLSKKYLLRHQQPQRYVALRDVITNGTKSIARRILHPRRSRSSSTNEEFWALQDVSFEVKQGDRVGIIGRNGAGKSTLLKLLSRITEPTTGQITLNGRVASLLEVGTGFHPELTGRENIYLNGAILGMSKVEIKRKFDEIVAFAEVEKFLDTPVKHYSSGMYVRLAFAVAAHLEPEILIVDEVLAVGDAQFQKKCLGKMEDVSKSGRTLLFVSHQMGMVSQLCNQALWLEKGKIVQQGDPQSVISLYLKQGWFSQQNEFVRSETLLNQKKIFIAEAKTLNSLGQPATEFGHIESIDLQVECIIQQFTADVLIGVAVKDRLGRKVFTSQTALAPQVVSSGLITLIATMRIPAEFLTPGQYFCLISLHVPKVEVLDELDDICEFVIADVGSEFSMYEGLDYGCVFANCQWNLDVLQE